MNKNYSSKLPETYKFPLYLFYQGKNCEAYKFFGVHEVEKDNKKVNDLQIKFKIVEVFQKILNFFLIRCNLS